MRTPTHLVDDEGGDEEQLPGLDHRLPGPQPARERVALEVGGLGVG